MPGRQLGEEASQLPPRGDPALADLASRNRPLFQQPQRTPGWHADEAPDGDGAFEEIVGQRSFAWGSQRVGFP